jgi:hypothetical protein
VAVAMETFTKYLGGGGSIFDSRSKSLTIVFFFKAQGGGGSDGRGA